MEKFIIYSKETCSFCRRAKELLDSVGLEYEERNLVDFPDMHRYFVESGFRTVPQIYYKDDHIGGYTDLEQYLLDVM